MIATMENLALLDMADDLAAKILDSEIVHDYLAKKKAMETSPETQHKRRAFIKIKERYDEVQRFGRYHPDYKEVTRKTRALKRELDMDEHVAAFRQAETALQTLFDEISLLLASAVSENIKVPTGNPFFEQKSSCSSGGCGSGGSCGCSA
ncbi:YlbF family regulator [Listeria ilorinensis]|uniref:YlbF family regulator n=1 Tax=Listeria ilorinensis TaxID=2867439 RepID=UPI001EF407CE|nr:YlbF family regulator [Listeria ilorinensis]